ncbi:hypothetical protein PCANC_19632 [Puccinia coronata f. sp. avenae]|uniref:Uncharacterized protein n=1 Tax=Puccinia coronata f. sp. avenae TaxID=200324 RepID=A0A2N5U0R2_9BASI|nr:hypothetical protein PCANC_19632 [Puccinia coronata f. sp. avenae]
MMNNGRLMVVSIITLLYECFQDCSSRPLPGEDHPFLNSWSHYPPEVPESPLYYTYADNMPFESESVSPQFSYPVMPQLRDQYPSTSISNVHGLNYNEDFINAYHQPSSSNTFSDHHPNLPRSHDMARQDWNPNQSELWPVVAQQMIHHQEMKNHGQIKHFASSAPDVYFAWISTLSFPSVKKLPGLIRDDWGLKAVRNRHFHLDAIPALVKNNVKRAEINLKSLFDEIDKRNKQFLMLFTPAIGKLNDFMEILRAHPNYQDMKNENASLLEWFSLQIESLTQLDDRHVLSPFQEMLLNYLKTDWSKFDLYKSRWQPVVRESRKDKASAQHATASLASAALTENAIHVLGNYYKLSNKTKFDKLFINDDEDFVETFIRMKYREYHGAGHTYKAENFAILSPLPWKEQDRFDRNLEVANILKEFTDIVRLKVVVGTKFVLTKPF